MAASTNVHPPAVQPNGYIGGEYGFNFAQLGARVPAVVISPLIPRNLIDHPRSANNRARYLLDQ